MRVRGIIMAGGRSERMRATQGSRHKALALIDGRPLVRHNLDLLLDHGIDDVAIVSSVDEPRIDAWTRGPGARHARARGARVASVLETAPLGNIGIVGRLAEPGLDLLVVYVDNVCSLDLGALVAAHRARDAALTIATHTYALRNPFGELTIDDGAITAYREKPVRDVAISSGTCVVAPAAAALAAADAPTGAAALFAAVRAAGLHVQAFAHATPWIDVNDRAALLRARASAAARTFA